MKGKKFSKAPILIGIFCWTILISTLFLFQMKEDVIINNEAGVGLQVSLVVSALLTLLCGPLSWIAIILSYVRNKHHLNQARWGSELFVNAAFAMAHFILAVFGARAVFGAMMGI